MIVDKYEENGIVKYKKMTKVCYEEDIEKVRRMLLKEKARNYVIKDLCNDKDLAMDIYKVMKEIVEDNEMIEDEISVEDL